MREWWEKHFDLLIKSGLNKKHLEKVIESNKISLRKGTKEFLSFLNNKRIPLLIFSSSGIGNTIPMILKKDNILFDNISIITNEFKFDKEGRATELKTNPIHVMNKDERILSEFPKIKERVIERENIILIGDSLGDLEMSKGFKFENILTIGFLNYKIEELIDKYKNNFDIILTNDSDFEPVNNLLQEF